MIETQNPKPPATLERIHRAFMDDFAVHGEKAGLPLLLGRCIALLMGSANPLCLDDMATALKVSKPAVSTVIRHGEAIGLVAKVYVPEHPRRDYYRVHDAFFRREFQDAEQRLTEACTLSEKALTQLEALPDSERNPDALAFARRLRVFNRAFSRASEIIRQAREAVERDLANID